MKAREIRTKSEGKRYKCIFFDLDHTLWDYEINAKEMLHELHTTYRLVDRGVDFDSFHDHFKAINYELWNLYDNGHITHDVIRTERFKKVLGKFMISEEKLCADLSHEYLYGCPKKAALIPFAKDVLEYLSERYMLTIVTNGFEEIQSVKLQSGNITHFFDHVVTSQRAGHKKPSRQIFEYALAANKLRCDEVIMIGDNLVTDIGGARNACIDTVYYNPLGSEHAEEVDHEIKCLSELKQLL